MRIAVTGGSGKLGRTVVRTLAEAGNQVINLDTAGERGPGFVKVDLTDFGQTLDAILGIDDKHRRLRRHRPPGCDPGPGHPRRCGDVPQQHPRHLQRVPGGAPGGHPQRRLCVERDRPRTAVRRAAALHPGRRGLPRPAREHVFAGQAPRRADGDRAGALGPGAQDRRAAILERDGRRRLRRVPVVRRRPDAAQVEPVGLHRRSRRGSGCAAGRSTGMRPASTASSSPPPTR